MPATHTLPKDALGALFSALRRDGRRILAPVDAPGRTDLREVETPAQVSPHYLQTTLSPKETVFPRVERLLSYTLRADGVDMAGAEPHAVPTVLFGARPCEAAGFAALDAVFNWDSRDVFFNARREQLTVVGVSCLEADEACFCTSVGGSPVDTRGSDILLTPVGEGFHAEVLTAKGEAVVALAPELFGAAGAVDKAAGAAKVAPAFDREALTAKLPAMFDHPREWVDQSLRCVGCGACAFVCPTCVCFDVQDEADARQGERLRCWDTCGSALFTLHASGHNPRELQSQRWRQRVYHKFSYYPQLYGMVGCVGCGKCTRACPVDMNLKEHLAHAAEA